MPQSMVDPIAGKSFQIWMAKTFKNVGNSAGYTIVGPQSRRLDCIAYAIDLKDVRLTPTTLNDLIRIYGDYGFYLLNNEAPKIGDAEVYSKDSEPRVPLHAHKIVAEFPGVPPRKPEEMTCSSKMGDDFYIRHPRNLLQCSHKDSNRYEYGIVRYRFRQNDTKFAAEQGEWTTTKTGRKVKKSDTLLTKSMSRIKKADEGRTKSNRITKRPRK